MRIFRELFRHEIFPPPPPPNGLTAAIREAVERDEQQDCALGRGSGGPETSTVNFPGDGPARWWKRIG